MSMRRFSLFVVLAAIAASFASAQSLDKILSDHYKASAQDKVSKITSVTTTGKNTLTAMGMETGFTLYQSRPNKLRIEAMFAGQKIIQTYNGTTGWMYAPAMGITTPQQLGASELGSILDRAEIDSPLWDYKARGKTVELAGESEDGSAYKINVVAADKSKMTIFINKESSLISKIQTLQMAGGAESVVESEMKDYRVVKGIPTAHYMAVKMNDQTVSTMTFESVEYNKVLDPSLFEKPVVE
jgi:outer membrane lipoprotein-sorting protein